MMRNMEIEKKSIKELQELILKKEISAVELTTIYLEALERANEKTNAVITFCHDSAINQAKKLDEKICKGAAEGSLHGIPFTAKDAFSTKGIRTTLGTQGLQDYRPNEDSAVIDRLKNSGAILIGKTSLPELSRAFETENLIIGETVNPYDSEKSAGGSSGGDAAVIALNGAPFGIGSDFAGSLRVPAHNCGVNTIRPTSFRVPWGKGLGGYRNTFSAPMLTAGPLARRVDDLQEVLKVLNGSGYDDPFASDIPLQSYQEVDLSKIKACSFVAPKDRKSFPKIADLIKKTQLACEKARMVVNDVDDIPLFHKLPEFHIQQLCAIDAINVTNKILKEYGTKNRSESLNKMFDFLNMYKEKFSHYDLKKCFFDWDSIRQKIFSFLHNIDVIITPVLPFPALNKSMSLWDHALFMSVDYVLLFSILNWPVVVIKVGEQDGMPIGVQIAAKPYREEMALAVAAYIEKYEKKQP